MCRGNSHCLDEPPRNVEWDLIAFDVPRVEWFTILGARCRNNPPRKSSWEPSPGGKLRAKAPGSLLEKQSSAQMLLVAFSRREAPCKSSWEPSPGGKLRAKAPGSLLEKQSSAQMLLVA